ncbi:hypothetical protein HDV02_006417 [Globomyces sp. JEL0801]|nr:hypothetical protein HDV02_006417 [Globomyces sp. JEL0801]
MAIFEVFWTSSQIIENNIFHNQFWSLCVRFWAYLLTFYSAMLNAELLKIFSILSTVWNKQRVFYYQILLLVLHILLCGGAYLKVAINFGSLAPLVDLLESFWLLFVALNNYVCSFYAVFLVYRDTMGMKARGKLIDVNLSQYWLLIATLSFNGIADVLGVCMYIYAMMTPFPDTAMGIRMNYALQRLSTSLLGIHAFMLTRVFIYLRFIKFSKEMSVKKKESTNT